MTSNPEVGVMLHALSYGNPPLGQTQHTLGVIKPVGEEFGYKVVRVDEIQDIGNITEHIIQNIERIKIILANLTDERPNCYYEAGFAYALGKESSFCIRTGSPIHFDLAAHRRILVGDRIPIVLETASAPTVHLRVP